MRALTVDQCESGEAGEAGHVEFHRVKIPRQLDDPVQPVAEGGSRLVSMQCQSVAKYEL